MAEWHTRDDLDRLQSSTAHAGRTRTIFLIQEGSVRFFLLAQTAISPKAGPLQEEHACMTKAELVEHITERIQLPKYRLGELGETP